MISVSPLTVAAFCLYLTVVVSIAAIAYMKTKNLSDFVLGGRSLSGPVAALSAGASDMSAWLFFGLPGAVFALGLNQIWLPIGLTIGAYCSWRFVAKPLRVFSEIANDSLTIPAFLDNRFFDKSGVLRVVFAIVTLTFFAFYTASGLVGGAVLLQRFGLDYTQGLFLGTTIIMGYTLIGGFLAVSWTDFFQGSLMLCCMLIVPIVAMSELGGATLTLELIEEVGEHFANPWHEFNALLIINLLAWGLGYLGQPHILVRYMAVKTVRDIPLARRVCISWMSLSMLGAVLIGFVGIAYFESKGMNPESVFVMFSEALFSPWLAGLLFAAILSSIMCAIVSQMLASSSALTEDLYHRLLRKKASQKELVWVGRISLILIAGVALCLAYTPNSKVIELVAFAWAGLASAFGPSVVLSLFWSRMTRNGAIAGVVVGASTVIIWYFLHGGIFELYEIIPGFLFGTLAVVITSLRDKPPSQEITDQFNLAWAKISKNKN